MKFKPGDTVRLVSTKRTAGTVGYFSDCLKVGEVGEVSHYYTDSYLFLKVKPTYMYHEDDLELVTEAVEKKQVGGDHYKLKAIQPWDIIQAWDLDFWRGNVVKYVLRAPYKNGVEDIEKAIHYLEYIKQNYSEIFKDGA